jgi:hypothetical protein
MLTFERPAVSRSSGCLMPVSVSSTGDADRPQSLPSGHWFRDQLVVHKDGCLPLSLCGAGLSHVQRPTPTSRMFIPSRAAPCRVPCGGLLRRRNDASTRPRPCRPGPGGFKKPGAAVAAPGVQGQQPHHRSGEVNQPRDGCEMLRTKRNSSAWYCASCNA